MHKHIKISPSILSADFARLGEEVQALCDAGADYIHVDVMDGHFVPNITIGPCVIEKIKKYSTVPLDVHLMTQDPSRYLKDFINAGADLLTVHIESDNISPVTLFKIQSLGAKAGIAISPKTKVKVLDDFIEHADLVLIMTVEPGFGNQKFMHDQLKKIAHVKSKASDKLLISVDGGINDETARVCVEHGANLLAAGSYIFRDGTNTYNKKISLLASNKLSCS